MDNKISSLTSPTLSETDLGTNANNTNSGGGNKDGPYEEGEKIELPIHTFLMENQSVVITVPDVHRIVDFLDEQSASLDYHFRKLGIAKSRFTYAQLHQLRRLNVIKRPTVCTYIAKHDVNRLLKMYETERNRHRMARVCFLAPVQLVRGTPPQQQIGNPKYIKPGAEKSPTALHTPVTPDYVGGALGVGINGTATNGGSVLSPPLVATPISNGLASTQNHNVNNHDSSQPSTLYRNQIKQSTSPTHHVADPISPPPLPTSGGFVKPSPVVGTTTPALSGKSFLSEVVLVDYYIQLRNT